jgi:hypothetical protein
MTIQAPTPTAMVWEMEATQLLIAIAEVDPA